MQQTSITHSDFVVLTLDLNMFEHSVYIYQPHNQTATLGSCKYECIQNTCVIPIVHII